METRNRKDLLMTMKDILTSFAANMRMNQPESTPKSILSHAKEVVVNLMISADNEEKMNSRDNTSNIVCSSESDNETGEVVNRRKSFEKVIEDYLGSATNSFHKSIEKAFTDPEDDEKNSLKKLAKIYYRMEENYKTKASLLANVNKIQEYQEELTS